MSSLVSPSECFLGGICPCCLGDIAKHPFPLITVSERTTPCRLSTARTRFICISGPMVHCDTVCASSCNFPASLVQRGDHELYGHQSQKSSNVGLRSVPALLRDVQRANPCQAQKEARHHANLMLLATVPACRGEGRLPVLLLLLSGQHLFAKCSAVDVWRRCFEIARDSEKTTCS